MGSWNPEAFPADITRMGALTVALDESLTSTSVAASVGVAPRPLSLSSCAALIVASLPTLGRAGCDHHPAQTTAVGA